MFIKPAQTYGRSPENQLRLTVRVLLGTGFAVCMYIYCTYMMVAGVQGAGAGTAIYDCSWCAGGRNCYCCIHMMVACVQVSGADAAVYDSSWCAGGRS